MSEAAPAITLDRHLFASNASVYDTAWRSFGWTPGLDHARAGRLEERVPWATDLADWGNPPTLLNDAPCTATGDPSGNTGARDWGIGTLPEAFLPLDQRLGFSLCGIIRSQSKTGRPRGRPRIATHTLLFDAQQFEAMDGYPQGIHRAEPPAASDVSGDGPSQGWASAALDRPAPWFVRMRARVPIVPEPLRPVQLVPDRESLRTMRLAEVRRSVAFAAGELGINEARLWMLRAFQHIGMALAGNGEETGRAHLVATCEPGLEAVATALVRAVWLGLPLADRQRVHYATPPLGNRLRASGRQLVRMAVGDRRPEMRDSEPPTELDGRRMDRLDRERLTRWVEIVTEEAAEHTATVRLLDVRAMSLFTPRSGPYVLYRGRSLNRAGELEQRLAVEEAGKPRWRALGYRAGRAIADTAGHPAARSLEQGWDALFRTSPILDGNGAFFDGVVRGLRGHSGSPSSGCPAVTAGLRCQSRTHGLELILDTLSHQVPNALPATHITEILDQVEQRDGAAKRAQMLRIAAVLLGHAGRWTDIPLVIRERESWAIQDPSLAADLVDAAVEWLSAPATGAPAGGDSLLRLAWRAAARAPEAAAVDDLQRLAWLEQRRTGQLTLSTLLARQRGEPERELTALAERLMDRNPDPPLTVFLALRQPLTCSVQNHHDATTPRATRPMDPVS